MEALLKSKDMQAMMASLMNPENLNVSIMSKAQQVEKAERNGQPVPSNIDLSVFAQCASCRQEMLPPTKPQRCSACKLSFIAAGSVRLAIGPRHTNNFVPTTRHMQRLPDTQAVLKSFTWGRLETDGTFYFELAKGRFSVLGSTGTGFWSVRGGIIPHQNEGDDPDGPGRSTLSRIIRDQHQHLDGHDLLHLKQHLTDKEGWKLPAKLIPFLDLSHLAGNKRPVLVTEFEGGVKDWDSWYTWRKLPKRSPAALLMNFPLTVYQLIVHTLGLTKASDGKPDVRVELCIHVLGPEQELNFLPLFAELALLLPYHDITLLMWGHSVEKLIQEAATEGVDGSLLRNSLKDKSPIFQYSAPEELGNGSVKIILYDGAPACNGAELFKLRSQRPELESDALVGLNAGLGAYRSWMEVIQLAHYVNIPFAVTDYAEQSLEHVVRVQLAAVIRTPPPRRHDIALNPFHRPGQRPIPAYKMPNLVNGFTLVVVGSD